MVVNMKKKRFLGNIVCVLVGIFYLAYDYMIIATARDYRLPVIRLFSDNYIGDIVYFIFRLVLLILLLIFIIKCQKKFFKYVLLIIFIITLIAFKLMFYANLIVPDENIIQKLNISQIESLESVYYSNDSEKFSVDDISIIYKKKIFGTIYCQKTIYNISSYDIFIDKLTKEDFINKFSIEKFYEEIKEKDFDLCGFYLPYSEVYYKNGEMIVKDDL